MECGDATPLLFFVLYRQSAGKNNGMVSIGLGGLCLFVTFLMKQFTGLWMTGNPFLILGVMFVMIGVQFFSMGLIGELTTRTYFESQDKRAYLVRNTLNFDKAEKRRAA